MQRKTLICITNVRCPDNCPPDNFQPENCLLNDCPLDNSPRGKYSPGWLPHGLFFPRQLPLRKITHQIIAPGEYCPPGWLLPDNYSKDNCLPRSLTIYPRKLSSTEIAFRMICRLHNCPSDKWSRGKLPPRKIVPRVNYTRYIFRPRIRNRSTLIDSFFLLFFILYDLN